MNWTASVLSAASSDTEPTIVLTFDSAKYIFNAGENTNRAFLQSRRNWKKTRGLFFTHVGTQRASGLPGLLMSFADATISRLDIVGPPGILHYLASMRSYTYRDSMPIHPIEATWNVSMSPDPDPLYKDDNITVYHIPIHPQFESSQNATSTPNMESGHNVSEILLKRKREDTPDLPVKRINLMTQKDQGFVLQDAMELPTFSPGSLIGDSAQEWRKLMINMMFPGTRPKVQKSEGKNQKRKQRAEGVSDTLKSHKEPASQISTILDNGTAQRTTSLNADSAIPRQRASIQSSLEANVDIYRRAHIPPGFHKQLPAFTSSDQPASHKGSLHPTLAYIILGPRVRGKFDVKKAEALGVPFGPKRGQLTKGHTITFEVRVGEEMVERVVRPEECVGESETPSSTLILDIPTPMHISGLLQVFNTSPFYSKFRSNRPEDLKDFAVRSVFHICGPGVLEDKRYAAFMSGFASGVHHVVSSREHAPDPVTFTSAAFNQLRLNQLDPDAFPIPKFSLSPHKNMESIPNLPSTTCLMSSNLLISMRPPRPPTIEALTEGGDLFHPAVSSATPVALPTQTLEQFSEAKANVKEYSDSGKVHVPKGADVKLIPLGTGSAVPTKYRNVSSTLIQIPNWGNILLDAGEGTWGQLARQFGVEDSATSQNVWDVLRDLKCIYISHIHGDHHMGLAKILAKRRMLDPPPSQPLYLVTIRAVHLYLREFSDLEDLGLDDPSGNGVITVTSESLHWKRTGIYQTSGMWQIGGDEPWTDIQQSFDNAHSMCRSLGLESFETVDVYHRTRCYGAVIKHTDGWSIVFSGDTQPTNNLAWAGKDATLLIHEATMADDQVDMAQRKAHSTFGQAIEIGKRMNAENILLTHFSARYPKMPPSGVARPGQIEGNSNSHLKEPIVALAFDHLNLTIGNMWKINYYLPAVEQSFRDTTEEDDVEDVDPTISIEIDTI